MYQILCDDYVIHDPRIDELQVINAKCELEVNKTGALSFQIHSLHPYYNVFRKHVSQITLRQDDEVLFRGRVLNNDITFENGYINCTFLPQDTQNLPYGKYYFDIEITLKNGYRKSKLYNFTITEETNIHEEIMAVVMNSCRSLRWP